MCVCLGWVGEGEAFEILKTNNFIPGKEYQTLLVIIWNVKVMHRFRLNMKKDLIQTTLSNGFFEQKHRYGSKKTKYFFLLNQSFRQVNQCYLS